MPSIAVCRPWRALSLALALMPLGCLEDEESADASPRADARPNADAGPSDPDAGRSDADARDGGGDPDAGGEPDAASAACALGVRPTRLDFGLVEPGRRAVLPVSLVNDGDAPCALRGLPITGAGLALLGAAPTSVPPRGAVIVDVRLDAPLRGGAAAGELMVDAATPIAVSIVGTSSRSALRVQPTAVSITNNRTECRVRRGITLAAEEVGAAVTEIRFDDGSSDALTVAVGALPMPIAYRTPTDLVVDYRTTSAGRHAARLLVFEQGRAEPHVVGLWADASEAASASERFAPRAAPLDVLFVIDDSPSMVEEQDALVASARAVIDRLVSGGVDFRIAATTTDPSRGGALVEVGGARWLDRTTADPVAAFTALVRAVGTTGAGEEAGLEATFRALAGPGLSSGFLRIDARLAVVVLSDEEDSSERPTRFFTTFLESLAPRQPELAPSFNAVVLLPSDARGCAGVGASPGLRYVEAAANSGGSIASICSADWGRSLAPITDVLAGVRPFFRLAGTPEPDSLEVLVDGAPVAAGWSYNAVARAVRFEAAATPPAAATVEIRYRPRCL